MSPTVLRSVGSNLGCSCATAAAKLTSREQISRDQSSFRQKAVQGEGVEMFGCWRRTQIRLRRQRLLRFVDSSASLRPRGMMREKENLTYDGQEEKLIEMATDYEVVGLSTNYLSTRTPDTDSDASRRAEDRHPGKFLSEDAKKAKDKHEIGDGDLDGEESASVSGEMAVGGSVVVAALIVLALAGVTGAGFVFKDQLNSLIGHMNEYIEGHGPSGYIVFILAYAALEILGIPAIPITMTAGLLFGGVVGTLLVSIAGTIAATGAFLIARYLMRDRILEMAKGNKQFLAIDRAIGRDGFRVVTLLRLSPLLPFSLGNYLYGLTSVELVPYIMGSWLGMLPGSWAYVNAGSLGRSFLDAGSEKVAGPSVWVLLAGLGLTVLAFSYITKLAKEALNEPDEE